MLSFLKRLLGRPQATLESYWCETPLKCDNRIPTPLGGRVSVVVVCVDVEFAVNDGEATILGVRLADPRRGFNIAAQRRGEAWTISRFSPESALRQAVNADLAAGPALRRLMVERWAELNPPPERTAIDAGPALVAALNAQDLPAVSRILSAGGRGSRLEFTYSKPGG